MNKIGIITLAASAMVAGCVSTAKNDGGDACLRPTIVKDIVHEQYTVDKNAITATESLTYLRFGPWNCAWGGLATHVANNAPVGPVSVCGLSPEQKALNGAFANACDQTGCDTLVGARYRYMTDDYWFWGNVTCEATGYPAKLTGVELIENKAGGSGK